MRGLNGPGAVEHDSETWLCLANTKPVHHTKAEFLYSTVYRNRKLMCTKEAQDGASRLGKGGPRDGRPSGRADGEGTRRELEEERRLCSGRDAEC